MRSPEEHPVLFSLKGITDCSREAMGSRRSQVSVVSDLFGEFAVPSHIPMDGKESELTDRTFRPQSLPVEDMYGEF